MEIGTLAGQAGTLDFFLTFFEALGDDYDQTGLLHSVEIVAVPEPSLWALLGLGLLTGVAVRRRR